MFPRDEILARLRAQVAAGRPIVGGGAGTGLSAKCAEVGGIDLIIIYNSGRFRMAGRGCLSGMMPYGDANQIVMDMAREVLPVVEHTPVLAGVCGTDPFRIMKRFLRDVRDAGFSGVQNFPTVGLIDGSFPAEPRRDRHGLRQGSRDDRRGPRAGPADVPVRLHRAGGGADGRGRGRRADPAHGADDQGHHRGEDGADAGRTRRSGCRRCATRRRR